LLDDLKARQLPRLAPAVYLTLETSAGNFQAWAALAEIADRDFARRLRKGTGADATASGATRVAGSLNFKDKYELCALSRRRAAEQRGNRPRHEPGGLRVVHDRAHLRMDGGGNRRSADGRKPQGTKERARLC
jgi:hypothetical protein